MKINTIYEQTNYNQAQKRGYNEETDLPRNCYMNDDVLQDIGAVEAELYTPEVEANIKHTFEQWCNYTDTNPELSGNDLDAFWQGADYDGSETSGGSASTPDQNIVDDNAKPWGIVYTPYEDLDINKKVQELEKQRIESEGWDDRVRVA